MNIYFFRWNTFRSVCNTDKKIGLALELSEDLPSYCEIQRWLGEPIKCVLIKTTLFATNKKGFPVLPRAHQNLLRKMFKVTHLYLLFLSTLLYIY